jgi:glycosyltransferase involved in cell wall biosynthesis
MSGVETSLETAAPVGVLLVAPSPPPYGGVALQARLLEKLLRNDGNSVVFFPSNFPFSRSLRSLERLPGVRTAMRAGMIWTKLWRQTRHVEIVHVLANSWLYFFIVVCPAVIVGRMRGKKVILNYRGGGAKQFFDRMAWLVKPIFKLAHSVTAPSDFLGAVIRNYFQVPVTIVPNILELRTFRYRHRLKVQPKLLVTRHLEKMYDIESVLKAFRAVQAKHREATLCIAGTGSEEEHLRALAAEWDLKNVQFLGHVPHGDLPAVYDSCDIYVNASRVDNFPGALLEASGAGLVVVSTCAGGIPFMYQHEKNALLVQPGDWQGLAQAIERVLQSSSLALALATEALTLARKCEWQEVRKSLYVSYGLPQREAVGVL